MASNPLNILFVEDSDLDYELMLRALNKVEFKFTPFRATSIPEFESKISTCAPNIILSDYHLVGFTGIDVINAFKLLNINIPFIIVSSNIGEEKAVEALKLGATDYMLKGHISKLPHVIERALEESMVKEQKQQTLTALHRREKMYSTLLNTMKDGLVQLNEEQEILFANPSFIHMLGVTDPSHIIGTNINTYFANTKQKITRDVIELKDTNQKTVYCEISKSVLTENTSFFAVVFKNITQEIEQKAQMTELNNELDMLIYRIAHDLRGPLCSLEGLLNIASDKLDQDWNNLADSQLQNSYTILDKLTNLVQVKKHQVQLEKINITTLANSINSEFKGVKITWDIKIINLISDINLLQQAIEPIIDNAAKYHPNPSELVVNIALSENQKEYSIAITDNGLGIAPSRLQNVLKMFYRGNNESKGTGLGLYLCHIIAEKLGGNIEATSNEKEFTRIEIKLPKTN